MIQNRETIPIEDFVKGVYASVDQEIACGLDRLRRQEGIVSSCKAGCCRCCRYHILINVAEAQTLSQYVRREMSADQINRLRARTGQWHAWNDSRPGRYPPPAGGEQTDLTHTAYCCPLLVNGRCIAYPVRPVVCRAHHVASDPEWCLAADDPQTAGEAPVVLGSMVTAASRFSAAIKDRIETSGLDFSRSQMLLPHWLAVEMGWDFSVQ